MCQVDKSSGIKVDLNVSLQLDLEVDLEMMPVPSMKR